MTRLNRKVEYALMALKVMAAKRQGEITSAKEIVEQAGCPFDATARVLQIMVQKEILKSEQGARGGYVLVRDLGKISLHQLMEMLLGQVVVAKCLHETDHECELRGTCNIVSPIAQLNRRLSEFYQSLSVGELLRVRARESRGLELSL